LSASWASGTCYVDLLLHQFLSQRREALLVQIGKPQLQCDVVALVPAEAAKGLAQRFSHPVDVDVQTPSAKDEDANLGHSLRLGCGRRKHETQSENDPEPDPPHAHLGLDGWRGV